MEIVSCQRKLDRQLITTYTGRSSDSAHYPMLLPAIIGVEFDEVTSVAKRLEPNDNLTELTRFLVRSSIERSVGSLFLSFCNYSTTLFPLIINGAPETAKTLGFKQKSIIC